MIRKKSRLFFFCNNVDDDKNKIMKLTKWMFFYKQNIAFKYSFVNNTCVIPNDNACRNCTQIASQWNVDDNWKKNGMWTKTSLQLKLPTSIQQYFYTIIFNLYYFYHFCSISFALFTKLTAFHIVLWDIVAWRSIFNYIIFIWSHHSNSFILFVFVCFVRCFWTGTFSPSS